MVSLVIIICLFLSATLFYSKRFTARKKILGLYIIQAYYLFIVTPLVFLAIFNLFFEIINRPPLIFQSINDQALVYLFCISMVFAIMGSAIHATSTSVTESFTERLRIVAFKTNEIFHGSLSHDMIYLGGIGISVFLAFLELNHPSNTISKIEVFILVGILIGFFEGMSMVWSTHIGINFIASYLGFMSLFLVLLPYINRLDSYPIAVVMLFSLATTSTILGLTGILVLTSKSFTKKLIKILFPKGHPIKMNFSIF